MDTQAGFSIISLFFTNFLTIQADPRSESPSDHQTTTMTPDVLMSNIEKKFHVFEPQGKVPLVCDTTSMESVYWKIGNTEVTEDEEHFELLENGKRLVLSNPVESILGNYTCRHNNFDKDFLSLFQVIDLPSVKLLGNPFVVEGEKLELVCSIPKNLGPMITWNFGGSNYLSSNGRVKLIRDEEQGIDNAVLTVENISKTDGGLIYCRVRLENTIDSIEIEEFTELVVKSKLAALWPFLGICAQFLILFIIIRVYEKKDGKTEVYDSDTDQSPKTMPTPTITESQGRYRQFTRGD